MSDNVRELNAKGWLTIQSNASHSTEKGNSSLVMLDLHLPDLLSDF